MKVRCMVPDIELPLLLDYFDEVRILRIRQVKYFAGLELLLESNSNKVVDFFDENKLDYQLEL